MIINFKIREISRGTCRLIQISILIKNIYFYSKKISLLNHYFLCHSTLMTGFERPIDIKQNTTEIKKY